MATTPSPQRKKIGELLVEAQLITSDQLDEALDIQRSSNELLGKIMVNMGYVTEKDVTQVYAKQIGCPFVDLKKLKVLPAITKALPPHVAQRHKAVPISKDKEKIVVAMVNPLNVFALDDIRLVSGLEVQPVIAIEDDIMDILHTHFGVDESMQMALSQLRKLGLDPDIMERTEDEENEAATVHLKEMAEDSPIIKLVNAIIIQAIEDRASDIHIEPMKDQLRVRYRVDGVMHEAMKPPKKIQPALLSRVKVMADLNIAERRVPQDGRINLLVKEKEFDFRVSTYPTNHGEKIVLRILDKSNVMVGINKLGFTSDMQDMFEKLTETPVGMILVTGPTGSGKSTTLYSVLNKLNTSTVQIYTVEDPVEYQLEGINQVEVNPRAGLDFPRALRSFLRHDPDILMVGEIRDKQTAEIAIQAALTGHLVLSTLHTNDAAAATTRLMDMGIEPFLVSSSVIGILAQRLTRILCNECKEPYEPSKDLLRRLGAPEDMDDLVFYKPGGCDICAGKGYKGRLGIFELMFIDDQIKELIVERRTSQEIKQYALKIGMRTLQADALLKIMQGITSVEEAMRVVFVA